MKNLLSLSSPLQLRQALNPQRAQQSGRYLFRLALAEQTIWLKLQLQHHSELHEHFYCHEQAIYQLLLSQVPEIVPEFQLLPELTLDSPDFASYIQPVLVIGDSKPLFASPPHHLTPKQMIQRLWESLLILEKLHHAGWVHGDLKPEHFRLQQGRGILIDYEQCFQVELMPSLGNHATPRYMAPELFHAESKTMATDIYALGIIWYEWLSQQRVYKNNYLEWAQWHCQQFEVILKPSTNNLTPLLQLMLEKNKARRLTDFEEIKQIFIKIV